MRYFENCRRCCRPGTLWLQLSMGVLLVICVVVITGCPSSDQGGDGSSAPEGPPVMVNLPVPPRLGDDPVPAQLEDGSHTVFGLMRNSEQHMNSKVSVTGIIDAIYKCPEGESPCEEPHFFMNDGVEEVRHRLMVVSSFLEDDDFFEHLAPGNRVTVKGRFSTKSMHGFLSSAGLVDADGINPFEEGGETER